jgi:hypothetical protein
MTVPVSVVDQVMKDIILDQIWYLEKRMIRKWKSEVNKFISIIEVQDSPKTGHVNVRLQLN